MEILAIVLSILALLLGAIELGYNIGKDIRGENHEKDTKK